LKIIIYPSRYLTFQRSIVLGMSLNSDDKNYDKNEDENKNKKTARRGILRRTYQRNDKPSTSLPMGVSALAIAAIAAAVVMLSFGAYFVLYAPSIHTEWHTSPQRSSYGLANPVDLIPSSSLAHITEATIGTFGTISMVLSAVPAIISFGLFRGRSWSWYATVIFFAVASASLLLTIGSREGGSIQVQGERIAANTVVQSLVYAGLSIAVLYYLTRPRVKTFFRKAATNDDNNSTNTMQHQSSTMPSS
jgi:hypothetical protein